MWSFITLMRSFEMGCVRCATHPLVSYMHILQSFLCWLTRTTVWKLRLGLSHLKPSCVIDHPEMVINGTRIQALIHSADSLIVEGL